MDLIKMLEDLAADKPKITKGKDFITISFKNKKSGRPKTKKYVRHSSKIIEEDLWVHITDQQKH